MPDGAMRIVSMLDRRLLALTAAGPQPVANLAPLATGAANDMVIDPAGRCYIGNFGFDLNAGEPPRTTVLIQVDPDGAVRPAARDLLFPNGLVITPDGRTLIVAETFGARLTAFEVALDGSLANRRMFALLDGMYPDGICLDAEGAVWVSCVGSHKVIRVKDGGQILDEIPLDGRDAYACMLGGADLRDLYLCTARHSRPERTRAARSGKIEVVRVEAPGAGLP